MASRVYPVGTSKGAIFSLPIRKRIILFLLTYSIQLIYLPTSERLSGGIEPRLPIDIFPIWAVWVVPYLLCYILWLGSVIWIIYKTDDHNYRTFIAACLFTFTFGVLIFIFVPTYVRPASLPGNDVFTTVLRMIHETWGRYDAFPSGHIYITALLALFFGRWYPRRRLLWILILGIVSLSTLFTGQHYIADVLGGFAVAYSGYHFGLWWMDLRPTRKKSNKRISSSPL